MIRLAYIENIVEDGYIVVSKYLQGDHAKKGDRLSSRWPQRAQAEPTGQNYKEESSVETSEHIF